MMPAGGQIPGYSYGSAEVARSPIGPAEFAELKVSAGFTEDDERYLRLAGEVLQDQTDNVVRHWRSSIIAGVPNLARHSRSTTDEAIPAYLERSNARFSQWILDTCLRPYDQDWVDYQQEIALRHTGAKKNQVDGVRSTPFVPLRDVIAFLGVMNDTIKAYLASKGHSEEDVKRMHAAWCKSMQLQMALWIGPYSDSRQAPKEW